MNKFFLKLAGILFVFSLIDGIVYWYWLLKCNETGSPFYCDVFQMGGLFIVLGIPAFILLGMSIFTLIFSKLYKKDVYILVKLIIILIGIFIFVAPYILLFFSDQSITYKDFQNMMEQTKKEQELFEIKECEKYYQKTSEWYEGQPMLTPPFNRCH